MSVNYNLYKKALLKYGERFKAIFAIMPDEVIEEYLLLDYLTGIKKLKHDFKFMLEKDFK